MNDTDNKSRLVTREFLSAAFLHVRENTGEDIPGRTITGYAVLFNVPSDSLWSDEYSDAVEVIAPEAMTREFLDTQDIKFTMFHDRQLILARSTRGQGSLSYDVDSKGVRFEFEAPHTADGDKALELVRRGDLTGCSFAFTTSYYDESCVERTESVVEGRRHIRFTVHAITSVLDFTLATDPAYPDTSVEAREFARSLMSGGNDRREQEKRERIARQVSDMRRTAGRRL